MARNENPHIQIGTIFLFIEIIKIGIYNIPITTLLFTLGQTILYMDILNVPWNKIDVCISPVHVIVDGNYRSLMLGTLEHGTDMHLFHNMLSFLNKGRLLEKRYGTVNFAMLLLWLMFTSSTTFVILTVVYARLFQQINALQVCALGFSGVIFALKVIIYHEEPVLMEYTMWNIKIPSKYAIWIELLWIHVLIPNASFIGHLSGIIAGLLYTSTAFGKLLDYIGSSLTGYNFSHNILVSNRAR